MAERRRRVVAVIGGSEAGPEDLAAAEAVGAEIARHGAVLLCGGGGGVMAAAAKGARAAGGLTIGLLPGTRADDANEWIDVALATGLGEARNALVARGADAVVAIGGRFGTLSEIAFALHFGRPVVGLGTWRIVPPGQDADEPRLVRAETPEEAVQKVLALEFYYAVDACFPYDDWERGLGLLREACSISPNSAFTVAHEMARVPRSVVVTREVRLRYLEELRARLDHPLAEMVIGIAERVVRDEPLEESEVLAAMKVVARHRGQYQALNVVYFAGDEPFGSIDELYDEISDAWKENKPLE